MKYLFDLVYHSGQSVQQLQQGGCQSTPDAVSTADSVDAYSPSGLIVYMQELAPE